MEAMMEVSIHRVVSATRQLRRWSDFTITRIIATDVDGQEFELQLFSDGREELNIVDLPEEDARGTALDTL